MYSDSYCLFNNKLTVWFSFKISKSDKFRDSDSSYASGVEHITFLIPGDAPKYLSNAVNIYLESTISSV